MSSDYPTSLPTSKTDYDSTTAVASSFQNAQGEDINAVAAKVGVTDSAVTTSVDYWIKKGWIPLPALTWVTYKTATASGDLTDKYQKGDKIKLNQTLGGTYALDLELSSSQYAWVADNADVSITGDISIEAWIKLESLPSILVEDFSIAGKENGTDKREYLFQITASTNKLRFMFFQDDATYSYSTSDFAFTADDLGKWVHVAVAVDVSEGVAGIKFYKNGVLISDTDGADNATSIQDDTANFEIGNKDSKDNYLDGLIKDVRLWDDIRTVDEIRDNRFTQLVGNETNLVGYWKFENDATDSCKSSDLTLAGGAGYVSDDPDVSQYYYLDSVVYSSPNTTFTFVENTDYVLANNAIVSPFYSRANLPFGFPDYFNTVKAFVTLSAAQLNLTGGNYTLVEFDTESYDIGSNFNTTTHQFTAPITGYYQVSAGIQTSNGAAAGRCRILPYVNGGEYNRFTAETNNPATNETLNISGLVPVVAGQTIDLYMYYNTGDVSDIGKDQSFLTISLSSI